MALSRRWIKLGRLFMVAWLAFFIYPLAAFLTDRFSAETRTFGLLLLLGLALIWAWFWTRVIAGPDRRFIVPALVGVTVVLTVSTLRTPPRYGSLFLYAIIIGGAAFPWRRGLATVGDSKARRQQSNRGGSGRGRTGLALGRVGLTIRRAQTTGNGLVNLTCEQKER
jgi:hypothetical protein